MKLFSTKEFAEAAGVSIRTLKYWRKSGKLIPVQKGAKGAKFYSGVQLLEVQKYLKGANLKGANCTSEISGVQNQECKSEEVQTNIHDCTPIQEDVTPSGVQTGEDVTPSGGGNIMAKADLKEIIAEIKQQDIGIAVEKYLSPARKTGFTCTDCGNGTGEDGTGATVYFNDKTNRHELKCHKCGKNLNILEIIAGGENLSLNKYEELLKAIEIACDLYGLHFDSTARSVQAVQDTTTTAEAEVQETAKATAADDKELAMIHNDIETAQKNLPDFIEKQDGKYRGLTYETYSHFGCGFLPQWIHPKTILAYKQGKLPNPPIPSQRFIISTANHYVAVMLKNDRTPKNKDYWKMHAGSKKEVFGADLLPVNAELIIIAEGEINAMSIWQATGYDVIATGGAADFKSTIQSLQAKFTAIDKKPKIAILFDSDKAGRDNAPRLREELLNIGFPAVCIFLSDEESDIDANDILVNEGDAALAEKIHNLIDSAQNDFADAEAEALRRKEKFAQLDSRKLEPEEKFALFSLPHSDLYNAQRLSMFHGKHIRFLTDSYHWYIYHDNKWKDSGKENSAVLPFAFDLAATIAANVDKTNDADTKLYKQWQKSSTVSNAIAMLKGVKPIRITRQDLNTHPHLLNCKNGVVDLQTGKLYPHDSKYLLTQCVNAVYRAGYTNDRVDKFLQEILPDDKTRQAVLRYLGYALTGDVSEEKALFIHGTGGNGKGTLTKTLLTLLDDYGCAFPIEAVLVQPRITKTADACTPAFNKLLFNRLAIADEIPAQRKMDYAVFKLLTGGDPVPIRKLYEEGAEIKNPTHKFIFSGNHLPELADTHDPGILRRLIVVRFEQDFTQKPDTKLKQFLQSDDALSALLNLLVAEAVAWYKGGGLIVSDKMRHDRDSYLTENDFISEFIEEYCIRGNDRSVSLKDFIKRLRDAYQAETFENYGKGDKALTKVIEKIPGITKRRITAGNMLFGIGWRDTDTVSADSTANSSGVDFGGKDVDDDDVPF